MTQAGSKGSVLITGGAGFIGANLARQLIADGRPITVLDNLSAGRKEYLSGLKLEFVHGDVLDADLMTRLVKGHSAVVHLAAQTGVPASIEDPRNDCVSNVMGTLNLLLACRAAMAEKRPTFVFASSNAVLGRQEPPATEDKRPLPISPYGASKLAAESYCLAFHGSWGLKTIALRFSNVYGPFSDHKESVVAKFIKRGVAGQSLTVTGDGSQTRDFIFVDDLCRAIICAIDGNAEGEVFQIATGRETSIAELSRVIQDTASTGMSIEYIPIRTGDIQRSVSGISKAESALGWSPRTSLREGIEQTWRYFAAPSRQGV